MKETAVSKEFENSLSECICFEDKVSVSFNPLFCQFGV